jgi:nuclear pore complex protein Nup98-Nup96
VDKTTYNPITDPERLKQTDYDGLLRRVCAKLQTRLLEYQPETGSWVFKVHHFSKYGLYDSDEDMPVSDVKKFKPTMSLHHQQDNHQKKQQEHKTDQQLLAKKISHGL